MVPVAGERVTPVQPAGEGQCRRTSGVRRPKAPRQFVPGPTRSESTAGAARRLRQESGLDVSINSFGARGTLEVGDNSYEIYRLSAVEGTEKLLSLIHI